MFVVAATASKISGNLCTTVVLLRVTSKLRNTIISIMYCTCIKTSLETYFMLLYVQTNLTHQTQFAVIEEILKCLYKI